MASTYQPSSEKAASRGNRRGLNYTLLGVLVFMINVSVAVLLVVFGNPSLYNPVLGPTKGEKGAAYVVVLIVLGIGVLFGRIRGRGDYED